ncbi:MAG: alpha-amylase family glycosyl hydrolase, partial [Burkholderiaceae bacterium]
MPFCSSPQRDNGYDVSDYYNVDPRYSTLSDFVEFTQLSGEPEPVLCLGQWRQQTAGQGAASHARADGHVAVEPVLAQPRRARSGPPVRQTAP